MKFKSICTKFGTRFQFKGDVPLVTYIVIDGRGVSGLGFSTIGNLNNGLIHTCSHDDPLLNDEVEVVKSLCELL